MFLLAGYSFFDAFTRNESRSVTEKFYGLSIVNKALEGTSPELLKTSAEYVDAFLKKLNSGNDK